MGGESTPVAQRIKPTKKMVLEFVRVSACFARAIPVSPGLEVLVQAAILMSLQFNLSGRLAGRISVEIRPLADASQKLMENTREVSRMQPRQAND